MRSGTLFSAVGCLGVCLSVCLAFGQSTPIAPRSRPTFGESHPALPGLGQGEQKINNQVTDPPRQPKARPVDAIKLRSEAAELRDLADALTPAIDQVSKGMMPKDLSDNLKRIEKLAKHLRSDVNP